MKKPFYLLIAVAAIGLCAFMFSSHPTYKGPFNWKRFTVAETEARDVTSHVFESIDNMKKVFTLEFGDECFYLDDEEWIWRDTKDPGFLLTPIFCPKKGGGWAMPPRK